MEGAPIRSPQSQIRMEGGQPSTLKPGSEDDRIAHSLQRAGEGGYFMVAPPRFLTLVHAVQQPLGRPGFTSLPVEHQPAMFGLGLQREPIANRGDWIPSGIRTGFPACQRLLLGNLRVRFGEEKMALATALLPTIDR